MNNPTFDPEVLLFFKKNGINEYNDNNTISENIDILTQSIHCVNELTTNMQSQVTKMKKLLFYRQKMLSNLSRYMKLLHKRNKTKNKSQHQYNPTY
jgi:hypothetical protein